MELARNVLLILHLAGMAGILISLLASRKNLSPGITHSALLAFLTGIALVGIRYGLNDQDPVKWADVDNVKTTIKTLFAAIILIFGFRHKKKEYVSRVLWWMIALLVIANITIAVWWK